MQLSLTALYILEPLFFGAEGLDLNRKRCGSVSRYFKR